MYLEGTEREQNVYSISVGKPTKGRLQETVNIDLKHNGIIWIGFIWLRNGASGNLL
jgi:hypothetical protein